MLAAAPGPLPRGIGALDDDPPALEGLVVQLLDRRRRLRVRGHFHEAEAAGLTREPVGLGRWSSQTKTPRKTNGAGAFPRRRRRQEPIEAPGPLAGLP
jgi:hypothetical protein